MEERKCLRFHFSPPRDKQCLVSKKMGMHVTCTPMNKKLLSLIDCRVCSIIQKKKEFDENWISDEDYKRSHSFFGGLFSTEGFFKKEKKGYLSSSESSFSDMSPDSCMYFCSWFPRLFGIDEENIPLSDEEVEGYSELAEQLDEKARLLTSSALALMRTGSWADYTDDELRNEWKQAHMPKYGRRARAKPVLEINGRKMECICEIDEDFSRHYIPQFSKGSREEGEELKTPHFVSFWEDYRNKVENADLYEVSKIFEDKEPEEPVVDNSFFYRPLPKFPGSKKMDLINFKNNLLSSFRALECREVRRYRMPYAEALYLELQEDLFVESAEFFKKLLKKDYLEHEASILKTIPLRKSKPRMDKLILFLKVAERFSRNKDYHKEATILLKSGKYFNDHDESWWWLAEALYNRAVEVSQKSVIDGGKSEAIARYILGTFLLDCLSRCQEAQEHLSKARELSLGKKWSAEKILEKKQDLLYKECANYLCRALVAASMELRNNGKPEEALSLIHRSQGLCEESGSTRQDVEMQTYFELGMTYHAVGMINWAKTAFRKYIEIAKLSNDPRNLCNGYLELAICFRSEGDSIRCHHNLLTYLETASSNKDENLTAFAHRYLGEFHLNNGEANVASGYFKKAFVSFHQQLQAAESIPFEEWKPEIFNLPHDVELTRVLLGLADGELLTKSICSTILQAKDRKNQKDLLKIINWKNRREMQFSKDSITSAQIDYVDFETADHRIRTGTEYQMSDDALAQNLEMKTVRFAIDRESFN